jgi:SulP family sulfate permease
LEWPRIPAISWPLIIAVLPAALSFTLLGGIESLLSAKVADSMTGRVHRSNMELVAQGIANIATAFFGGICVTGTIARTATNIRAGAQSPFAGIMHSLFILLFMIFAAPLARYVPLAALAGVLVVVSWNMAEKAEFLHLMTHWRTALVLLATFLLTLIRDLSTGIAAGCALAVLFALIDRLVSKTSDA